MTNYCERCDKLGFDKCLCPKPYTLKIGDYNPLPYKFLQSAILAGQAYGKPFTVDSIEPKQIVCYWQPGMSTPVYDRSWEDYEMECQKRLEKARG